MLRRERLRVAARVAGRRPGAGGGVEQVRLGDSGHRARQDDSGARQELPPPLEAFVRVLRLGGSMTTILPLLASTGLFRWIFMCLVVLHARKMSLTR